MYRKHPNHTYGRNRNNSANNRANIALDVAPTYADLDLPLKICARDTIGLSY